MSSQTLLAYIFVTFIIGIGCAGMVVVIARRWRDPVILTFLGFYLALTVLVATKLVISYLVAGDENWPPSYPAIQYLESFIGRYGLMLTLPLLVHRLAGWPFGRADGVAIAVVGLAFVAQHITEFGSSRQLDDWGDVAEDVLFGLLWLYALVVCVVMSRRKSSRRGLLKRIALLMIVAIPAMVHDLFFAEDYGFRFYPLWYAFTSLAMVHGLWNASWPTPVPDLDWMSRLSPREREIAGLLKAGLSNRDIGDRLFISTNTVKTHLKSIYEKGGIRSRYALLAQLNAENHPTG